MIDLHEINDEIRVLHEKLHSDALSSQVHHSCDIRMTV